MQQNTKTYTAFLGNKKIATGALADVAGELNHRFDHPENAGIVIFDDLTSRIVDIDWRGSFDDVLARLHENGPVSTSHTPIVDEVRGPGRPKMGVVAREVTLLPRHWAWLGSQRGGASAALRRLVEQARRNSQEQDRYRELQESVSRFMTMMAGDFPGYEEATRAFYRSDRERFQNLIACWPEDVRDHLLHLANEAFEAQASIAGDSGSSS